jgi:hypothetical protein
MKIWDVQTTILIKINILAKGLMEVKDQAGQTQILFSDQ